MELFSNATVMSPTIIFDVPRAEVPPDLGAAPREDAPMVNLLTIFRCHASLEQRQLHSDVTVAGDLDHGPVGQIDCFGLIA